MDISDEEELSVWQDVLDRVMAGRVSWHSCPFCGEASITAEIDEFQISVRCEKCGKYIEGRLS